MAFLSLAPGIGLLYGGGAHILMDIMSAEGTLDDKGDPIE